MRYLIDGYNAAHWLNQDDDSQPSQLRQELLAVLQNNLPRDASQVDVYWDVKRPNPSIPDHSYLDWCTEHNVPDADAAIIDAVYDAPQPSRCTVVSRDREVTGKSRQLGAKTLSPSQLLRRR